jgi:NAD(P) transhydrogenase
MQEKPSPADPQDFDVIVLGSGPGGEGAAMRATKAGKRVAVIEKYREVGGGCTHWATIPSKALRQAVRSLAEFRHNPLFADALEGREITFPMLLRSASAVIHGQVDMRRGFYDRNRVRVIHGHARFVDPHTVEVETDSGARPRLRAAGFVIATGSRPYRPPDVDFDHPRVFDSDTILGLDHTPSNVTIYGAGVVGCEYASIFRGLEVKVNLVNNREKLLAFLDDEIIDALSYHLRDQGVVIRHNETYERIEARDDGVVVHLKSGKKIKSDVLLWANGRTGNTQELGLDTSASPPTPAARSTSTSSTAPASTPTSTPSATSSATPASPPPPTTRAASPPSTCSPASATPSSSRTSRPASTPTPRSARSAAPSAS